jgi:hypothetical protein
MERGYAWLTKDQIWFHHPLDLAIQVSQCHLSLHPQKRQATPPIPKRSGKPPLSLIVRPNRARRRLERFDLLPHMLALRIRRKDIIGIWESLFEHLHYTDEKVGEKGRKRAADAQKRAYTLTRRSDVGCVLKKFILPPIFDSSLPSRVNTL